MVYVINLLSTGFFLIFSKIMNTVNIGFFIIHCYNMFRYIFKLNNFCFVVLKNIGFAEKGFY